MATAADIYTHALKRIRVVGAGEPVSAEDAVDALAALNQMMFSWKVGGVDTNHTTLLATDDFPLEPEFERGVIALLAVYLAPLWGKEADAQTQMDAESGWNSLLASYSPINLLTVDVGLQRVGDAMRRYSVLG